MKRTRIDILIGLCFIFILLQSCTPKGVNKNFLDLSDKLSLDPSAHKNNCKDVLNYIPDPNHPEQTPIRNVRLNFHIMNSSDKSMNFDEELGVEYVHSLIERSNYLLENNNKMWLPKGVDKYLRPTRFRYELASNGPNDDGIYFHYDDEMCYINTAKNATDETHSIFSSKQYDEFGQRKEEVLNIFLLEHHPDSLKKVPGKPKYPKINGVGSPHWVKVADSWLRYKKHTKSYKNQEGEKTPLQRVAEYQGKFLNHEVGHSLGLPHTWATNDGCDDTPKHNNCWFLDKKSQRCDTWDEISNNVMDYNAEMNSYSPCQIGKIHYNMSKSNSTKRQKLSPDWCQFDPAYTIAIDSSTVWSSMKELHGNLVIENNQTLRIECLVSLAKGAKIEIHPKGKLVLGSNAHITNRCNEDWAGIEVWESSNNKGQVIFESGAIVSRVSGYAIPSKPKVK